MKLKQIAVFIENTPGRSAKVCETRGKEDINIRALSMGDSADFGVLRLVTNDPVIIILLICDTAVNKNSIISRCNFFKQIDRLKWIFSKNIKMRYRFVIVLPVEFNHR